MIKKSWLLPSLLLASIAHGKGVLVMVADELKHDISPKQMVSPDYSGSVVERVISIEEAFDTSEELNSPKNVRILQKYIHEVDHDILLDGVVLVGDFPMPTPHFTDEPAYIETTESTGLSNSIHCSPSRSLSMTSRAQAVRDTEAVLAHYRRVREAVYQGHDADEGLADTIIAGDIEMAELIRSQHPLAKEDMVQDSFWISRLAASKENENARTWDLAQLQTNSEPSYFRRLSQHGKDLWGKKFRVSGARHPGHYNPQGAGVFFNKEPAGKSVLPVSYEYIFGSSSPHFRTLSSHTRVLDYPGVQPNGFHAGVSVLHTTEHNAISEHLRASLLIASWFSDGNSEVSTPEHRFKLASNWWFSSHNARSVIFSATPVSHDIVGEALTLLLDNEYQYIGDFYLALQKRMRSKNKSKALNNLILVGSGTALMPKLDLTTINKSALASLYPDAFNDVEKQSVVADQGGKSNESTQQPSQQTATNYSHYLTTAINVLTVATFVLFQRQVNPAAQANNHYKVW